MMSTANLDSGALADPIVTASRPRWLTAWRTIFRLGFALLWVAAGIYFLRELLVDRLSSNSHFLFGALATAVCFSLAAVDLFILKLVWKRPFAINHAGVELLGHTILWENITSCRWNIYSRSTLMIEMSDGKAHTRHTITVPESHRALVEETFRHLGKWEGAQPESIPA
jgi:hypothetical protein